jgi:hypothetical protein
MITWLKNGRPGIAERFSENLQERPETLSIYSFLCIASTKDLSVRSISISRHNRLYYRVTSISIEVLDILTQGKTRRKTLMVNNPFLWKKLTALFKMSIDI